MASFHDTQYLALAKHIITNGTIKQDRTNTGTLSVFGSQMEFDLRDRTVPILTSKRIHIHSLIHEIIWYFSGSTNVQYLRDHGVKIWNNWADEHGELGPMYGHQLRNWRGEIDQLTALINLLATDPNSRRLLVSYWDPSLLPVDLTNPTANPTQGKQALAPCHFAWQVYTREIPPNERGQSIELSLKLYQRSADVFLGVPFNIAQYSIIMHLLCHVLDMAPGSFIWSGGDVHVYSNHVAQINEQLSREPLPSPHIEISSTLRDITQLSFEDVILPDYIHHAAITGAVAV